MEKLVLITGSTDGIGKQTAIDLAELGYNVIIHGRNSKKCQKVAYEIRSQYPDIHVNYMVADLSDQSAVKNMSDELHEQYDSINILINNAGLIESKRTLVNGIEKGFMVNHLSHFYLTLLLLDLIRKGAPSRIINVSSQVHASSIDFDNLQGEKSFNGRSAYGLSKLANIYFTQELASRLDGEEISVNSLHPGVIDTNLLRSTWGMRGSPVTSGSKTSVYLATSNEGIEKTGRYFSSSREATTKAITSNNENQLRLWQVSEQLLSIDADSFLK